MRKPSQPIAAAAIISCTVSFAARQSFPRSPGCNKEIVADQVRQLYCKENIQHTKNGTNCTYEVLVVKNTNVSEPPVKGIDNAEQALFIEQELERRLHLEDEPVRGELPR